MCASQLKGTVLMEDRLVAEEDRDEHADVHAVCRGTVFHRYKWWGDMARDHFAPRVEKGRGLAAQAGRALKGEGAKKACLPPKGPRPRGQGSPRAKGTSSTSVGSVGLAHLHGIEGDFEGDTDDRGPPAPQLARAAPSSSAGQTGVATAGAGGRLEEGSRGQGGGCCDVGQVLVSSACGSLPCVPDMLSAQDR